jgi:hypothetical protein
VVGAGGPAGIHARELVEPQAFEAVQQPPQHQHPLGPNPVGQVGQLPGGHAVDRCRQGRQIVGRAGWRIG